MINPSLLQQVSYIQTIDPQLLRRLQEEISAITIPWKEEYSEYQTGGWLTLSLMNNTGNAVDTLITDAEAIPTDLLETMPEMHTFLNGLGLKYMWVRLANMKPGAGLWEHVDYTDLDEVPRFRLHLPITDVPEAFLIIKGYKIRMKPGYMWKLDPTRNHAATNFGSVDRIHLLIDCYVDDHLTRLMEQEMLRDDLITPLPSLPSDTPPASIGTTRDVVERWFQELFFRYNLGEYTTYDLLAEYNDRIGDRERAAHWREVKKRFIPKSP